VNESLNQFYTRALEVLRRPAVRNGKWRLLECAPAWDGNGSWDTFIAFAWQGPDSARVLVAINYAGHPKPVLRPRAVRGPRRPPLAAPRPSRGRRF